MRTPTLKQARKLAVLAGGYAVLEPKRSEWIGLLRAGWVERASTHTPRGGLLPPLRITKAGHAALAALNPPEEGTCSETTSAPTYPYRAASGGPLPSLRLIGSGSPLPSRVWTRPSCSSGSALAPTRRLRTARHLPPLPATEDVIDELDDLWRGLEDRAADRERSGGYHAGWRCWGCKRFVSGPTVTCSHCGQAHGGIYHEAYATR